MFQVHRYPVESVIGSVPTWQLRVTSSQFDYVMHGCQDVQAAMRQQACVYLALSSARCHGQLQTGCASSGRSSPSRFCRNLPAAPHLDTPILTAAAHAAPCNPANHSMQAHAEACACTVQHRQAQQYVSHRTTKKIVSASKNLHLGAKTTDPPATPGGAAQGGSSPGWVPPAPLAGACRSLQESTCQGE